MKSPLGRWSTLFLLFTAPVSLGLAQGTGQAAALLLEAYGPDGKLMNLADFSRQTSYSASPVWSMNLNYGVFPLGKLPASRQIGSAPFQGQFVTFTIPANQPVYFTSLWKADGIGTVYMRADNAGRGYTLAGFESRVIQLPYEFAASEFAVAGKIAADNPAAVSAASAKTMQQASALMEAAHSAQSATARAAASYEALGVVMRLKEQLTIEISNAAINRTGSRKDFILNFEGFDSWSNTRFTSMYNQAKAAGFSSVLTMCDWNRISPAPGVYDFSDMDRQVNNALALGYTVTFGVNHAIGNLPSWMVSLPFEELKALYYRNAFTVAQRYKDKVAWIYAQSEPELTAHGYRLEQLAELTRQSFDGARAGAPGKPFGFYTSAAAYVGYQLNPQPFADDYVSGWDLLNYMVQHGIQPDFVGVEMQYATVFAPVDLERQAEILQAYYEVAQVPIHIGETGYSSKFEDYGISAPYWRDGLMQNTQAEWADGLLRIAYSRPYITGFYWVHLAPDNETYNSDFLTSLVGVSLFRADGTRKRAFTAVESFTSRIAGFKPGSASTPATIEATGGTPQTGAVYAPLGVALQATVRDFLGNVVPGVSVTFTAPSTGPSGIFPGSGLSATAPTNSFGVATAPPFTATGTAGPFQIVANVEGAAIGAIFTLTTTPAAATSSISSVTVANGGADIAQNAWIVIKGKNLAPASTPRDGVLWSSAPEFTAGKLPTQLGGQPLSVFVNSKQAFLYFFCSAATNPTSCPVDQINVLTPLESTLGPIQILVVSGGVASTPFTVNMRTAAPAFPLVGSTSYLVATHADNSLIGPASLSTPDYPFAPARPGETIVLYAFGFGLPRTPLTNGSSKQSGTLPTLPVIQVGGVPASVAFAGVIGPGLYQLNVVVPSNIPDGDNEVTASYASFTTPRGGMIAVQR